MSENTASIKAAIAPASASLRPRDALSQHRKQPKKQSPRRSPRPRLLTPPSEKMLGITVGQFTTLVAEISVIEKTRRAPSSFNRGQCGSVARAGR